jgi:hypothetical protein
VNYGAGLRKIKIKMKIQKKRKSSVILRYTNPSSGPTDPITTKFGTAGVLANAINFAMLGIGIKSVLDNFVEGQFLNFLTGKASGPFNRACTSMLHT